MKYYLSLIFKHKYLSLSNTQRPYNSICSLPYSQSFLSSQILLCNDSTISKSPHFSPSLNEPKIPSVYSSSSPSNFNLHNPFANIQLTPSSLPSNVALSTPSRIGDTSLAASSLVVSDDSIPKALITLSIDIALSLFDVAPSSQLGSMEPLIDS